MTIKCREITKKYIRLPPPQAVPFTGFHFARIKSREPIAEQLKEFMKRTKETNYFTTGLIIAEWGEGKTDAYQRYIKPEADSKGDYAYLVSTSTIVNKLSKADILLPYGRPESETLAACIFYALRDELTLRKEDLSKFPNYREYREPSEYIEEVLTRHLNNDGKATIYLFIDEFEEILAQKSGIQKKFLSGLKELLNGQLKLIHEGGKFAGRLHFILACTPYAYNRIRGDVDLAQIFGALDQRLSSNRIYLPQIRREEALEFLVDLLRFCYKDSLPQPLPIKSSGILNGICIISQRNLRSLVQLLSDLLSAAALDGELSVIGYDIFLDTFKGKPISVYGASTQCIDKDLLLKIEFTLGNLRYGDEYIKIFRLLAGELKPFSIEEIRKRINVNNVSYRVNEINQELRKIGISNAITRLNPLKEDKKIEEVLASLKPVENEISFNTGRKIPLEKFKDEIIQYEMNSEGRIYERMFLPSDREDLQKSLDLSQEEVEYLYQRISRNFSEIATTRHFMLSKELIDQLFPSPLVLQLDFIADRSKRMDLWREAMKRFLERDLELRDGLIEVINKEDVFKITVSSHNFNLNYMLPSGIQVDIPLTIHSTTSRVTLNDAVKLKEFVKKEKAGLILLFHVGEIEERAQAELTRIPNVLTIHIRPIRAQQLIALSLARKRNIEPNGRILDGRLREILYEMNFNQEFNKWLEKCRKEGLLVEDLKRPSGKSERSLAQAIIYYIQTIDDDLSLQNVFEESKKLQKLTLYGRQRTSFAPLDIETEDMLNEYQRELCLNGFLREEGERIFIATTPIEERILNNLDRKLSIDEMKRRFIILAQNERLLEQVYLPILEAKGLIQVLKNELTRVDREEEERRVRQRMKNYRDGMKNKDEEWWTYAHICISKEREDRIIMLKEFDNYLRELFTKLDSLNVRYDEKMTLRTLRLIDELLTYFETTLKTQINTAYNRGRELIKEVKEKVDEIENTLDSILHFYNKFSETNYSKDKIEEYDRLKAAFNLFIEKSKKDYGKKDIEEGLDFISSIFKPRRQFEGAPRYFYFKRNNEQASYFNYKVYEMEQAERAFSERFNEVKKITDDIIEERRKLVNIGDESRAKLLKYYIDKQYIISSTLHRTLLDFQIKPIKPLPLKTLSLKDVYGFVKNMYKLLSDFNYKIGESLRFLNSIIKNEKTLLAAYEEILDLAKRTVEFFDEKGELLTKAHMIFSSVERTIELYKEKAFEFQQSMESLVEIDEINKKSSKIDEYLINLINSLEQERERLKDLHQKSIDFLKKYEDNIIKFLEVLEGGGIDIILFSRPFKEIIEQAITDIEELAQRKETKYTWKQILDNLDEIRSKMLNEVKNILSEDQFNVLLFLIDASSKQEWFDLSTLTKKLVKEFNKSEKEINGIVESLIQRKLLKQGVSLPI